MSTLISFIVASSVAYWVYHISYNANASRYMYITGNPTWSLVIASFIGAFAFTYGVTAL